MQRMTVQFEVIVPGGLGTDAVANAIHEALTYEDINLPDWDVDNVHVVSVAHVPVDNGPQYDANERTLCCGQNT